ncbi:MAG: bidirectional hydrogenase complex protein HoxE [Capsulimonadaceae bacterium]
MAVATTAQAPPKLAVAADRAKQPAGDNRYKILESTMKRNQHAPDSLIEILHHAQELFGYLEDDLLLYIARKLKLPPSRVYGVATFYHFFSLKPKGKHVCVICTGTACHVKGSNSLLKAVCRRADIQAGDTTRDGAVSLLTARCIGACSSAPAVVFDGAVTGPMSGDAVLNKVEEWLNDGHE